MEVMTMGTTRRHMRLLARFGAYADKKEREDLNFVYGKEQIALVENYGALIDVASLSEQQWIKLRTEMGKLKYTYPDFMIFKSNPVIINDNQTRYAGIPDLIIEVWFSKNTEEEKEHKRNLYRTNKSEFWEIDQDSVKVVCWNKDGKKYEQIMDKPLITPWDEQFDLVDLAYEVTDHLPNDRFSGGPDIGGDIDL